LRCFRLQLERLGVRVVALLLLVQLLDDLIDGERVQVLDDQMEKEPISNLLNDVQGGGLQNGFNVRTFGGLSTLKEK